MVNEWEAFRRLGELVRERREELGLTQGEVSALGGPSPGTQRQIEAGHADTMRPMTFFALEKAIGWEKGSSRRFLKDGTAPKLVGFIDEAPDLVEILLGRIEVIERALRHGDVALESFDRNVRDPLDDVRERLEKLAADEGLSPAQLADKLLARAERESARRRKA